MSKRVCAFCGCKLNNTGMLLCKRCEDVLTNSIYERLAGKKLKKVGNFEKRTPYNAEACKELQINDAK